LKGGRGDKVAGKDDEVGLGSTRIVGI
jgi:hypothetical protein